MEFSPRATDLHHDIFFFLILILVFVSRILVRALWHFHYQKNPIPQRIVHGTTIEILKYLISKMDRSTASHPASSSSSNNKSQNQKRDDEREKIRSLVIDQVVDYLDRFKGDLLEEFPQAKTLIENKIFIDKLQKSILDFGDGKGLSNFKLSELRTTHNTFLKDFEGIDEPKNNIIYDNIRVLLRNYR